MASRKSINERMDAIILYFDCFFSLKGLFLASIGEKKIEMPKRAAVVRIRKRRLAAIVLLSKMQTSASPVNAR